MLKNCFQSPQNISEGSVLVGAISYGVLSFGAEEGGKNPQKNPVSYQICYLVPPNKVVFFYVCASCLGHFRVL